MSQPQLQEKGLKVGGNVTLADAETLQKPVESVMAAPEGLAKCAQAHAWSEVIEKPWIREPIGGVVGSGVVAISNLFSRCVCREPQGAMDD
ncbi:MAG: hypothetical protein Q8M31_10230 [Beijerinckiaceae bacterium]|nr:hypothetical protein [Beijerinckiaceae bacterium]